MASLPAGLQVIQLLGLFLIPFLTLDTYTCDQCKCTYSKIKKRISIIACLWKLWFCRYIGKLKSCYHNIRSIIVVS